MKAALIPPIPHLPEFGGGSLHLLLAHLLVHSKYSKYKRHYKEQRERGAYIILDNSAHEKGAGQHAESLMHHMVEMNAQEVVVPDVLWDGEATVEAAVSAHECWYEGEFGAMIEHDPALMYVPQGKDMDDWAECLYSLLRIHQHSAKKYGIKETFVIGISKDYEVWDGGLHWLIANFIEPLRLENNVKFQVHLLGWGRDLWELNQLAKVYPWIRSTDSAKPFVYALSDIQLEPPDVPEYPRRPGHYFFKEMTPEQINTAAINAYQFERAAKGEFVL